MVLCEEYSVCPLGIASNNFCVLSVLFEVFLKFSDFGFDGVAGYCVPDDVFDSVHVLHEPGSGCCGHGGFSFGDLFNGVLFDLIVACL